MPITLATLTGRAPQPGRPPREMTETRALLALKSYATPREIAALDVLTKKAGLWWKCLACTRENSPYAGACPCGEARSKIVLPPGMVLSERLRASIQFALDHRGQLARIRNSMNNTTGRIEGVYLPDGSIHIGNHENSPLPEPGRFVVSYYWVVDRPHAGEHCRTIANVLLL